MNPIHYFVSFFFLKWESSSFFQSCFFLFIYIHVIVKRFSGFCCVWSNLMLSYLVVMFCALTFSQRRQNITNCFSCCFYLLFFDCVVERVCAFEPIDAVASEQNVILKGHFLWNRKCGFLDDEPSATSSHAVLFFTISFYCTLFHRLDSILHGKQKSVFLFFFLLFQ